MKEVLNFPRSVVSGSVLSPLGFWDRVGWRSFSACWAKLSFYSTCTGFPSTPARAGVSFHPGACGRDLVSRRTARGLREWNERRLVRACSDGGRASQAGDREAQEAGEVRGPRSRCVCGRGCGHA